MFSGHANLQYGYNTTKVRIEWVSDDDGGWWMMDDGCSVTSRLWLFGVLRQMGSGSERYGKLKLKLPLETWQD